jgi:hypothetical protein
VWPGALGISLVAGKEHNRRHATGLGRWAPIQNPGSGRGVSCLGFISTPAEGFAARWMGPLANLSSRPTVPNLVISNLTSASRYTVQQTCIPQAMLGGDIICQAKSGLGKTAVFVLTTLQQVEPVAGECSVLVMCHTRELAFQIRNEYNRFSKYMPDIKTGVFYGGTPIQKDAEILKNKETHPHIIVGTPGRLNALVRDKHLRLGSVRIFVLDECDKMLDQIGKPFCAGIDLKTRFMY